MAEIGAKLRDARLRERIDISQVEADTKIRAKYLRALENEEWSLLPGPTFVKSFLRTYADYLGLDGRMLVEQFKLRHEHPDAPPIARPRPRERSAGRQRGLRERRAASRRWIVLALVALLLAGLFVIGRSGGGPDTAAPPTGSRGSATETTSVASPQTGTTATTTTTESGRLVRLRIVPTGPVYACLRAAGGRTLLNGVVLQPGASTPTFRSSRLRLALGNGDARLVVDGRSRSVPQVTSGIAYEITADGVRRLPGGQGPSCS